MIVRCIFSEFILVNSGAVVFLCDFRVTGFDHTHTYDILNTLTCWKEDTFEFIIF